MWIFRELYAMVKRVRTQHIEDLGPWSNHWSGSENALLKK
jgi:hypothetical protein